MSCPFKHLWPSGAAPQAGQVAASAAGSQDGQPGGRSEPAASGGCPFSRAAAAGGSSARTASAAPPAAGAATSRQDQEGLQPTTPASAPDAASPVQCPFLAGVHGVSLQAPAAADSAGAASEAPAPAGSGSAVPQAAAPSAAAAAAAAPAVCPLGFGSSQQPRLGEFHCLICKWVLAASGGPFPAARSAADS